MIYCRMTDIQYIICQCFFECVQLCRPTARVRKHVIRHVIKKTHEGHNLFYNISNNSHTGIPHMGIAPFSGMTFTVKFGFLNGSLNNKFDNYVLLVQMSVLCVPWAS